MKNLKCVIYGGITLAILAACASTAEQSTKTISGLDPAKFDSTINEKPVKLYTLKNQNGMEV